MIARPRRGAALIFAIVLLGLVGATLALLATNFAADAKRTSSHAADAQARQLLIAGHRAALASADTLAADKPLQVDLPPALAPDAATLSITGPVTDVHIDASAGSRRASERITLAREGNAWKIASATLENP